MKKRNKTFLLEFLPLLSLVAGCKTSLDNEASQVRQLNLQRKAPHPLV